MRISATFIPVCMAVIAASLGATAFLVFAISAAEAIAIAATALSLLAIYNVFASRSRERADFARQVTDLSRGTTELARQVGEIGRRLVALEGAATRSNHSTELSKAAVAPLADEIDMLGALVTQLAESVAVHESVLAAQAMAPAPYQPVPQPVHFAPPPPPPPPVQPAAEQPVAAVAAPVAAAVGPAGGRVEAVEALAAHRAEMFLQPIVTLPQRRVRHYEAVARLRTATGALLPLPDDAESARLMPPIDTIMILRAIQVARRIAAKNRDAVLVYTLSRAALSDAGFVAQVIDFLTSHRALAPNFVLGISHAVLRAQRPAEKAAMVQITSLGFRFLLDAVEDLAVDPRDLSAQGVRFVRAPAALLLDRSVNATGHIHVADLSSLMARYGIDLIAGNVETEGTLVDLLDYEIGFGQGALLSPARPVRSEVFANAPEDAAASGESAKSDADGAPTPQRRRTPDTPAPTRPAAPERPVPGLAKLARNVMRRA